MSYDVAAAQTWDDEIRTERAKKIASEMLKHIPSHCKSAMEFGCGTGLITFNLAEHFDRITLIDSSQGMIDVLTEKIKNAGAPHMFPEQIDLTKEAYQKQKFDIIYSSMVLHHVVNTKGIVSALFQLLYNGGHICFVDLDTDNGGLFHSNDPSFGGHHGFEHAEMVRIFSEAGFRNVSIQSFYFAEREIGQHRVPYSLFCLSGEKP